MVDELPVNRFLGIPFVASEPGAIVDYVAESIVGRDGPGIPVHLIPVHGVSETSFDREFLEALNHPGVVIPDGRWLEILTRNESTPLKQLRGTDLFQAVCERGLPHQVHHYFLGSSQGLLEKLTSSLMARFPGIVISGAEPYPFGELSEAEKTTLSNRIEQAGVDVVWLGISTPRQNKEALWLSESLGIPVICVGAALEFFAGAKKMAPVWMQRAGLEWLYRFATEPRRLWRRYVFGSFEFFRLYLTRR